ncbi:unnamed protein product [Mytilus coruscus]|uniref:TRIM2_3 n=1 Tax=Mytilus coruscus TaxID=42192 RepID=A0A6J8CGG4_MYTCO|nr:unnamed protein product [Mytilus coruscus]
MSLIPSHGYDITFIDEKTVAITSGDSWEETGIDIIDIENQSKIEFISLPNCPYGITRDGESLLVCVAEHGIYKVNTLNYTKSLVIRRPLEIFSYVSVFTDKIYYTHRECVVCCDRDGSRVWTFSNFSILKYLSGISADNDGNVYVVGKDSSNMVIISNDGKHHKEILTKGDGLCEPTAIFFDKQNMKLLVANSNDVAFLYNVK